MFTVYATSGKCQENLNSPAKIILLTSKNVLWLEHHDRKHDHEVGLSCLLEFWVGT